MSSESLTHLGRDAPRVSQALPCANEGAHARPHWKGPDHLCGAATSGRTGDTLGDRSFRHGQGSSLSPLASLDGAPPFASGTTMGHRASGESLGSSDGQIHSRVMRALAAIEPTQVVRSRLPTLLSPLRYPGAKRRLLNVIRQALDRNGLHPDLFVEPFCGGASASLQLLAEGRVDRIALADRDPLIASLWQTIFSDADWLIQEMHRTPTTVQVWQALKRYQPLCRRGQALKCLFLNRTSFSGVIDSHAGPIGGMEQRGPYTIDCRFPKKTIERRIRLAAALAPKVTVLGCLDWDESISWAEEQGTGVFLYLDPPFIHKAQDLYGFYFRSEQHAALRDRLTAVQVPWLLSYDSAPEVWTLYCQFPYQIRVQNAYTIASAGGRRAATEVLVSNLPSLPLADEPKFEVVR